jgi:hypothetical protein
MSDAPENPTPPPTPPPTTDYASAAAPAPPTPTDRKRNVQGIVLGVILGIVIAAGAPIAGATIDSQMNRGDDLAGLGGLIAGLMAAGALLFIATGAAFVLGARRRSARLRGAGWGLLMVIGLAALSAGICAVAM